MNGEIRPLVTDELVEFEKKPSSRFKTLGELPIILEESMGYSSN